MDSIKYHKKYWDKYANEKNFVISLQYEKFTEYVKKDDKILDVGCGYGRTLNQIYHNGYKYLNGIDISINMIERVEQICSNFKKVLFEEKNYKTMNGNDCNGFYYIGTNIK